MNWKIHPLSLLLPVAAVVLALMLAGCGKNEATSTSTPIPAYGPNLALGLPDTLTGGPGSGGAGTGVAVPMAERAMPMAGGDPCMFNGAGNNDPFKNGHMMTKFLVGAIASWTCIADRIIDFVDLWVFFGAPTDGTKVYLANDPGYKAGDAAWLSILDTGTSTTLVLYWVASPNPLVEPTMADAGFYLTWNTTTDLVGKLVADLELVTNDPLYNPNEDPKYLRLDFTESATQKTGDMYIGFTAAHPWATGWRIEVVKNLDGTYPKFTATGALELVSQWDPAYAYAEVPQLKSFAVAESLGTGAAIAQMADLGLVLQLDLVVDGDDDHLGTFLFTKDDRYYFGMGPQAVVKNVTAATYKGDQAFTGGGWLTTAAQVDSILDTAMGTTTLWDGSGYTEYGGTEYGLCTSTTPTGTNCIKFMNALFSGGEFGADGNMGTEPAPGDLRRDALDDAVTLDLFFANACPPAGTCTWDMLPGNIFDMVP